MAKSLVLKKYRKGKGKAVAEETELKHEDDVDWSVLKIGGDPAGYGFERFTCNWLSEVDAEKSLFTELSVILPSNIEESENEPNLFIDTGGAGKKVNSTPPLVPFIAEDYLPICDETCPPCKFNFYPQEGFNKELIENKRKGGKQWQAKKVTKQTSCMIKSPEFKIQPQFHRKSILFKYNKPQCECKFCMDPTNMNTFYQGFPCMECESITGFVIPVDSLDSKSPWNCIECKENSFSHDDVMNWHAIMLSQIQANKDDMAFLHDWLKDRLKKRIIHGKHFLVLKICVYIFEKIVEEVFSHGNPDEFFKSVDFGMLVEFAHMFVEITGNALPDQYHPALNIPLRIAGGLVLQMVTGQAFNSQISWENVEIFIKSLYFREDSGKPLYEQPASCNIKHVQPFFLFERRNITLLWSAFLHQPQFSFDDSVFTNVLWEKAYHLKSLFDFGLDWKKYEESIGKGNPHRTAIIHSMDFKLV